MITFTKAKLTKSDDETKILKNIDRVDTNITEYRDTELLRFLQYSTELYQ